MEDKEEVVEEAKPEGQGVFMKNNNMYTLLQTQISQSALFISLQSVKLSDIASELPYKMVHLLPYNSDNQPSYAFVVLYKMIQEGVSYKKLKDIM